jgi:small GTP-binding protein
MYRVVLVGDTSVGKTSILKQLTGDSFDPTEEATFCARYSVHAASVDDSPVELQIWDTAGQERYRALGPIYYQNSAVALAVFAINDRVSFSNLSGWIKAFRETAGTDTLVFVVANKMDLRGEEGEVDLCASEQWAASEECFFRTTSALTGDGIENLFKDVAVELRKRRLVPKVETKPAEEKKGSWCC